MWQFQGQRVTQTPGSTTPPDSFFKAIDDLDNIPLTYNPNRRDRLSGQFDDNDRFPSLHDVNVQSGHKHTITWGSEDTMSTLKVAEDQDSSVDDLEAERPKPPAGPPPAVGFWDPGLRETRWTVLKKYSITCKYPRSCSCIWLTSFSINTMPLRPRSAVDILGSFVSSEREPTSCYHRCC